MDLEMVLFGALIITSMALIGSTFLGFLGVGIAGYAFPKLDRRLSAKAITAIPPVTMCALAAIILVDKSESALTEAEATSIPAFAAGAMLALLVAWPLSYLLVRRMWRLDPGN